LPFTRSSPSSRTLLSNPALYFNIPERVYFSIYMAYSLSEKQHTTCEMASTSRIWARNWLPRPSPRLAPFTNPAISTNPPVVSPAIKCFCIFKNRVTIYHLGGIIDKNIVFLNLKLYLAKTNPARHIQKISYFPF